MFRRDVTMADIYMARKRTSSIVKRTSLASSPSLTEHVGVPRQSMISLAFMSGNF